MKKITLVICVLLMLLLLPVTVSALGNISVSSNPTGATILVDSIDVGVTPMTVVNVTSGSHNVLLQKTGYQNNLTSITVVDGETVTLSAILTSSISAPTITSITPPSGFNSTSISITSIAGTGFSTSSAPGVVLMKSGQTNITATGVTYSSATSIACTFDITNKQAGYWNVIVTNPDGQSATLTSGFEIKDSTAAVTLSSITPSSAQTNTTVSITSLSGTGFVVTPQIILRRSLYNDLYGTVTAATTTNIVGTFDLTNRVPGSYQVCVINSGVDPVCGLTFTINSVGSTANGSINVKSSPSISKIFLNSVFQDYTPKTLYNLTPGTYTVMIRSAGYNDYSESVAVTAGNISYVTASLVLAPEVTTATVTAPTTTVTAVKTTAKSTAKVPTPWPSATPTPAPASPVGVLVILGAVGVGFVVIRKM
ncbi:MAG: PEGA domain-containing protein [Methanoregula sp.]|nr:PEGA domain-containing protein [Methanoregula sp.]